MFQQAAALPFGHSAPLPFAPHNKAKQDLKTWGKKYKKKGADFVYIKIHEHMVWPLISKSHKICLKGQFLTDGPGRFKKFSSYKEKNDLFWSK